MGNAASLQLGSYSTSEQLTRYKWIDGKPIYKKTISLGTMPNNATKYVDTGIGSSLGIVIDMVGYAKEAGGNLAPLPYTHAQPIALFIRYSDRHVGIITYSDRSAYTESYVTLYYTKT